MKTTSVILSVLTVANVWRAWGFAQHCDVMEAYGAAVSSTMLAVVAGVWAAVFITLLLGLWRKAVILRWVIPITLIIYAIWIAVQPSPSLPLTIWHTVLIAWTAWRLRSIFRDEVADPV